MAIYEIKEHRLEPLLETTFDAEGIYERKDLQRYLKRHINVLSPDLYVITEEFGDWYDSSRRIDLLCIDREANLVVVELKRTTDGGHMDLQAIRYAAMVSTMTFKQLCDVHAAFREKDGHGVDGAEASILSFLRWGEADEEAFATNVRIVLAAADFSKEITTSVMWLNGRGLDIQCVRLKPYRLPDSRLLLDVQQLIPLPEASDFQTQLRAKEQASREGKAGQTSVLHQFWSELLKSAKGRTDLHSGRRPTTDSWISTGAGKTGLSLTYSTRKTDSQVELYIDFGDGEKNRQVLKHFEDSSPAIEAQFGGKLDWQDLPKSRGCRIRYLVPGGWQSPKEEWPTTQGALVDAMIRLEKALRPFIDSIPQGVVTSIQETDKNAP